MAIEETLADVVAWERRTFPHATTQSRATHLQREVAELENVAHNLWVLDTYNTRGKAEYRAMLAEELADCLMLLGTIAAGGGIDLGAALRAKFETVQGRTYGPPDEQGVSEHIRG